MNERWKPSVTVAAIAARRRTDGEDEYLLVEEETPAGLRLNNPAGHLDPGESPEQAVVREALEETARVFTPQAFVGVYLTRSVAVPGGADVTYLRLAYVGAVAEADPARRLDEGIVGTLWMTLEELRASRERHRSPLVLRCIEDAAAGRRHPLDIVFTDPGVLRGAFP
ncbi:MAG: NUDIX hydrolase [Burkholderiales bacterium]|nr:NUDIX hydrolase [Burkholderiales bacterium]